MDFTSVTPKIHQEDKKAEIELELGDSAHLKRGTETDTLLYKNGASHRTSIAKPTRSSVSGKSRLRAVSKNGNCNIFPSKIPRNRLIRDIFTTLVDSQWRWTLTIFSLGFFLSWLSFALGWWLVSFAHGDLEGNHLPPYQVVANWTPCVMEIYGFSSCFLFSVETQHTTGYGQRTPTEECPEAIFLMCLQNIIGLIIEAFLVGIVFAKMTRPKLRTQTLRFSKHAVICKREDRLCLMFRVGDMRKKSKIIEAKLKSQLICSKKTKEGELLHNFCSKLKITADDCDGDLIFMWPTTVVHQIDEASPLYHLSAGDMLLDNFEILVTLEGTIESTDQKTQARSSYLPHEILWGHRFESVVCADVEMKGYKVDYAQFDKTVTVTTPLCSGAELAELYRMQSLTE